MPLMKKLLRVSLITVALTALCALGASATSLGVGTITVDALRLRSEASTESSILATASLGDVAVVLENAGEGWYKVDYKSVEGYMSGEFLTVAEQADVDLGYGLVRSEGSTLNLRSGAGIGFDVVTILYDHSVVTIHGIDNGWYKVNYKGRDGYVLSDYLVTCLDPSGTRGDGAYAASTLGQEIVAYAKQFLGTPYVWGGDGPNRFDCSGFTKYVYAHFGYTLNRTATAQLSNGYSVSRDELQPGDLIFFYNGKVSTPVSHVGIYVGDGQFIHASTNTYSVQFNSLYSTHYSGTYRYARRII